MYKDREVKSKLVVYKGGRCFDCGAVLPDCCYHFDHRNPIEKSFSISGSYFKSLDVLKKETDKCDLVCANCHAIRTYGNEAVRLKIKRGHEKNKPFPFIRSVKSFEEEIPTAVKSSIKQPLSIRDIRILVNAQAGSLGFFIRAVENCVAKRLIVEDEIDQDGELLYRSVV